MCDASCVVMSVATRVCGGADVFGHVGGLVVCKSVNYTLLLNAVDWSISQPAAMPAFQYVPFGNRMSAERKIFSASES